MNNNFNDKNNEDVENIREEEFTAYEEQKYFGEENSNTSNSIISEQYNNKEVEDMTLLQSDSFKEKENNQQFYREVIEKKPKTSKLLIASVLSAGIVFGTVFGYSIDNFIWDKNSGSKSVGKINGNVKYVVEKTVSSVEYIAEKVSPSVVAVQTTELTRSFFGGVFENEGLGSGVIISDDGYIVTNNHVIEGANDIKVVLNDGKEYKAKIINRDSIYDLAVIKIEANNLPYVEFGDSSSIKVGQLAVAIGNPVGKEYSGTVTAGIISGLNREFESGGKTINYIQTDAAINPGNSGGALLNSEGKLIGINTLKVVQTTVEGMGFAIPANEVKEIVDDLINRPYMGIQGKTITKEDAETYNLPLGVYVADVVSNSGADKAGLKKGDIIISINNKEIQTMEEVIKVVKQHNIGDEIELEVVNQYDRKAKLKITLTGYVYE